VSIATALSESEIKTLLEKEISRLCKAEEPNALLTVKVAGKGLVTSAEKTREILEFIEKIPSGVIEMSKDIENLPETSANLGVIKSGKDFIDLCVSIRSSVDSSKKRVKEELMALAEKNSYSFSFRGEYPAWEYRKDSRLRDTMCEVYRGLYNKEPKVITIHAGLECGIFTGKIKDIDCVSIGPDNFDIHTPEERLSLSSSVRVWEYLKEVLKKI
jgi:dipeptidase D